MNKLILALVMALVSLVANAQYIYDDGSINNRERWIDLSYHKHVIGTIDDYPGYNVYMDIDVNDNHYLAISGPRRTTYGDHRTPMKKGQHLYIKLDNDSIIDLVCESGYYYSSVFVLSNNDIRLLMTHNIVKLRLELSSKYIDPKFRISKGDVGLAIVKLRQDYEDYQARLTKQKKEAQRQEQIKANPLYDF